MNDLNVRFSDKFGEFEKYIKEKYNVNELYDDVFDNDELKDNKVLWKHSKSLRNIYSHGGLDFADINPEKLKEFCFLVDKFINPRKVLEVGIKESDVYKVTDEALVNDVIQKMLKENYTCTPIVDDSQKVIGVFSSNSFMIWAGNEKEIAEDFTKTTIKDIMDYCKLDSNKDIIYKFVSRETKEDEVRSMFKQYYENNKRLETVFITHNGKPNESLLGIITHWDL